MTEENFEPLNLADMDDAFSEAEVQLDDHSPVPDGTYQVSVDKVELTKSKSGNPMLKWELRIIGGNHRKRKLFKNSVITHNSMPYFKKDLVVAGLNLSSLSELETRVEELLDIQLEVKKATKGEYTNIWINKRIEIDDPDAPQLGMGDMPF